MASIVAADGAVAVVAVIRPLPRVPASDFTRFRMARRTAYFSCSCNAKVKLLAWAALESQRQRADQPVRGASRGHALCLHPANRLSIVLRCYFPQLARC